MKEIFTERFNQVLKEGKINQTKLAEQLGISKQCVSDFKSGRSFPSIHTLKFICLKLEVSADYLLGIEDK